MSSPTSKNKCCVLNCESREENKCFKIPKRFDIAVLWLEALKFDNLKEIGYEQLKNLNIHVCSYHFKPKDFTIYQHTTRLIRNAVPSLNMPTENSTYQVSFYINYLW